MIKCSNCESQAKRGTMVCLNCGTPANKNGDPDNTKLRKQVSVLKEALEHYADELNWMIGGSQIALPRVVNLYTPVNERMTIQRRNGYDIARKALATAETTEDDDVS